MPNAPEFTEGLDAARESMEDLRIVSRDALGEIDGVAKQTFGRIEGFMVRSLQTGKFEWRDLASEAVGALRQILDAQLETAGASSSLFGGSGGGGILGALLKIGIGFLGAAGGGGASSAAQSTALSLSGPRFQFAHGGRPPLGVASLVGEVGPELFIPDNFGTIVPNDRLGGSGNEQIVVNYNIDARGAAPGVEQRIARALRETENRAVFRAKFEIFESARRGGTFARMARV